MEMGGKMPMPDTFLCKAKRQRRLRVGSIMTTASSMPGGDKSALPCKGAKWRVPQAKVRAFISPLSGGRCWRMAGRSDRRTEIGGLSSRLGKVSVGCRTYRNGDAPDTVTQERCRE